MDRRAQAWYLDVVMALFIFASAMVAYHYFSINIDSAKNDRFKEMSFAADALSSTLLKEGYPVQWNSLDVVRIGITHNDQKIDPQLWMEFTGLNYTQSKQLLGMTYDFLVFFEDAQGNITKIGPMCAAGMPSINFTAYDTTCSAPIIAKVENLLASERYVFAQGQILKMKVYVIS